MKFSSPIFAVPTTLAAVLFLANCSSDAPAPANPGGAPAVAGSSPAVAGGGSAGKGAGGSSGGSLSAGGAGAGAGGSAGGVSSAGSAGSAGAGTAGGAAVEASFATFKALVGTSCNGGNGCHGQEGNPLPMAADDKLYATVIAHTTANCGKLINPTNAAQSGLIKLLQADCGTPPNVTSRMPFQKCFDGQTPEENESCVPTATVAAIQAWIANGAPQ